MNKQKISVLSKLAIIGTCLFVFIVFINALSEKSRKANASLVQKDLMSHSVILKAQTVNDASTQEKSPKARLQAIRMHNTFRTIQKSETSEMLNHTAHNLIVQGKSSEENEVLSIEKEIVAKWEAHYLQQTGSIE